MLDAAAKNLVDCVAGAQKYKGREKEWGAQGRKTFSWVPQANRLLLSNSLA